MPIKVHLPDGRVVNFPDGMPPEAIQAEVAKLSPPTESAAPTPPTPQSALRMGAESVFGRFAPMAQDMGELAAKNMPGVGLLAHMMDEGAPVGGAIGGVVGGALSGGLGAVPAAGAGGAAGGLMQRWFRGEPTTGGDVALDATVQGGMQAVAPAVGGALTAAARPLYRAALQPGKQLATKFGDIAKTGIEEGVSVSPSGLEATRQAMQGQNPTQRARALLGLLKAQEQAEVARLSGGKTASSLYEALASTARMPGVTSRAAIGMDRTGRAVGGDRLANAARALMAQLQAEE